MLKLFICCVFFLIGHGYSQFTFNKNNFNQISKIFHWNQMEYIIDNVKYTKNTDKQKIEGAVYFEEEVSDAEKFFIKYNNVPVGIEADQTVGRERVFITVPRRRYGIPSTLNYLNLASNSASPLLIPYPNSEKIPSLVSVYRPRIDACKRLWVVDTGLLEVPNNFVQKKQPEIIIFDINTDQEIHRQPFSPDVIINGTTSGFTSITVDVMSSNCDDAYAYITDLATNGLVVYSLKERAFWRFNHRTLNYDIGSTGFNAGDYKIDWKDGLFSIALSEPDEAGSRKVYYHPFISTQEYSISTDVLKNKTASFDKNFKVEGVRGPWSQSGSHGYHSGTKTMLFANIAQTGILCWNTQKPLTSKTPVLVAHDRQELNYISDLKIEENKVWLLTNNMPKFISAGLDPLEENFALHMSRKHRLFAVPACRTVSHSQSPVPRSLSTLNALLDDYPECDVFADEWKVLMLACLRFCEECA